MIKVLVVTFLIVLSMAAKQIARVDLTSTPKTHEPPQTQVSVKGGGVLGHGTPSRSPDTLPLSLRITVVHSEDRGRFVVEVEMTNIGKNSVSVPVGTDPVPLMNPSQLDRMRFSFTVFVLNLGGHKTGIGFAESASNRSDPESKVTLRPGDSMLVSLPAIIGNGIPSQTTPELGAPVSVSLSVFRKDLENGVDWDTSVGDIITSDNTVPLPAISSN